MTRRYETRDVGIALHQADANQIPIRIFVRGGRDAVDPELRATGRIVRRDTQRVTLATADGRRTVRVADIVTIDRQDGRRWWPRSPFPPPTPPQDAPAGHPRPLGPIGGDGAP